MMGSGPEDALAASAGLAQCGAHRLGQGSGRRDHPGPVPLPELCELVEEVQEPAPQAAGSSARREVGAAEEGLAIGGEPHAHRPPSTPGEELYGRHVDRVDVGSLLPVDLDRHVSRVQQARDLDVLEGLALHDVAPVAGRVTDREEHGPAGAARHLEGLVAPWVPVHRVVGVLLEVRAALQREPVDEPGNASLNVVRPGRAWSERCGGELPRQRLREGLCTGEGIFHPAGLIRGPRRGHAGGEGRRERGRSAPRSPGEPSVPPPRSPPVQLGGRWSARLG